MSILGMLFRVASRPNDPEATRARSGSRLVPFRQQMSGAECGAACLAMVLSYHGRETSVAECREHCDVGRDGLTTLTIARAARSYGLRTKGYSLEPENLGHLSLPAILHWNFNHFVVLERWSPGKATIVDPMGGRRRLTADELDRSFTGVSLTLEPGVGFERRTSRNNFWLAYLRNTLSTPGTYGVLAQILLASALLTILGLAIPLLTKVLVDDVMPVRMNGAVTILGLAVAAVALALLVINYLRGVLVVYLQARLDSQMMLDFFEHVLSLPFRFFQQRSSGDLLARLGSNATIREMVTTQTVSLILDGLPALPYGAILLPQAPLFGLAAVCSGVLQIATVLFSARPMHTLVQRDLDAQAEAQSYAVEALAGIATLKASGAEHRALDHWSGLFFRQLNFSVRRNRLEAAVTTITSTLNVVSPILLLLVGALYVLSGSMSLGTVLALQIIAVQFLAPIASLVAAGQQLQVAGAHLERIADVMQAEPEQDVETARRVPVLSGAVELRGVGFRYDQNAPWALRGISFSIEPGQKIALVGRTGSGKSTLAKLLLGLYETEEGEVLYDGTAMQELDYRTLRAQFGTVMQEASVFGGSIRQNISFHDPDLTFEKIKQAAGLAAVHDDIERMPMGYETGVAEGGGALSGGQRQRIALARALVSQPALVVLDEATSNLDAETEEVVSRNLSALACTRVVIAHRLSTIRDADLILVLDRGEIVERGSHEELVAKDGHYAALIDSQLERDPNA